MAGPRPHIPFPPDLILYVNLVAYYNFGTTVGEPGATNYQASLGVI